ncbi:MAG TPA: ABC transporter permease [Candidatus Limnocylindrales bacterium]|nr:ABC transporter permease [Candidatus Limnocylindrales bacterium]
MDTLLQDIKFGGRMLIKNPLISLVAALTLALGIGANTAIFSAVNGLLLRPLPVQNADRLTVLSERVKGGDLTSQFSYLNYRDLRAQTGVFSDLIAYNLNLLGLEYEGKPDPVVVSYVSGNYFSGLGLKPAAGRLIYGDDAETPGGAPVVVLGYSYWKKRFNLDPSIVGRQVKLNGTSATVVGVAPEGFHGLYSIVEMQAYLPLGMSALWRESNDFWTRRDARQLKLYGVLKPGVSMKQAQSAVNVVMQRLAQQYPENKDFTAQIYPERLARPEPDPSNSMVIVGVLFMVLAGLVLLLACTNVANIILVRATARSREMAVRAALGAARTRLIRQLMTESILLAAIGGAGGLLLGAWVSRLLGSIQIIALGNPLVFDFSFDWRVFAFGLAAALVTGILVGSAPAFRVGRANLSTVLHEGSRGVLAGTARSRMRNALVVVQVAGSLMLLVVAGLFVRSTRNAERMYLGFDPSHVLNATMDASNVGFDKDQARKFYRDLEDRVRALPGVQSASLATTVPMGYNNEANPVYVEGRAEEKKAAQVVLCNSVGRDYFATMRIPIERGRTFTDQDTDKSPLVAIVNPVMAQRYWPNQDPIGKRFSIKSAAGPFLEIVGVARQGKYLGPAEDPAPFFYMPGAQHPQLVRTLQVRTASAPESLIPEVEREIHSLAPGLPLISIETMEQSLEGLNGLFFFRMGTRFAGALGLLGLVLALVGVYGVISYAAAQRTHEIGVRMALGASRASILKMVLKQGCVLIGAGVVAGLALTFVAVRGISSLLVGVSPTDPLTLAAAALLLAGVGFLASLIPARRAMRVEPLRALKYE